MVQVWVDTDDERELVDVCAPADVPTGWIGVLRARGERGRPAVLVHADTPALRRMAAFDVVVNNADRKGGHVLAGTDGHLYGVDHGLTPARGGQAAHRALGLGRAAAARPTSSSRWRSCAPSSTAAGCVRSWREHITRREIRTLSSRVDDLLDGGLLPGAVRLRPGDSLARVLTHGLVLRGCEHVAPMPAAFIGHGSPTNALEQNRYTRSWHALGAALPRPRAILVISAHWYINATAVTAMRRPRTIHDFFGFSPRAVRAGLPGAGRPGAGRRGGGDRQADLGRAGRGQLGARPRHLVGAHPHVSRTRTSRSCSCRSTR